MLLGFSESAVQHSTHRATRVLWQRARQSTTHVVTSGIHQGSVLSPILIVIFINDLPDVISTRAKLFADGTKVYDKINRTNSSAAPQSDCNKLVEWLKKLQMKFHSEKNLCMRIGRNTKEPLYTMTRKDEEGNAISVQLKTIKVEKDLGIYVDSNLDFKTHINQAAAKANRPPSMIRRSFEHLDRDMILNPYKGQVWPLLEYGHLVWSPHHTGLIDELEKVQH